MKESMQTKTLVGLHYLMRLIVIVALVRFVFLHDWIDVVSAFFILILMITPAVLKDRYKLYLPFAIEFTIVAFIFVSIFLGSLSNYYEKFAWWDGILHFLSGILVGIVGFLLVYILSERKNAKLALSPFFISIFSVSFSLAIAVFREIYEYFMDTVFGYRMRESGLPDTMSDLIVCTAGALLVGTVSYVWMRHQAKVPFTPKRLHTHT